MPRSTVSSFETEKLIRAVAADENGEVIAVATVDHLLDNYYIYIVVTSEVSDDLEVNCFSEDLIEKWLVKETISARGLNALCIVPEQKRLLISIKNAIEGAPEIMIMNINTNEAKLEALRIINLPDFKTISSLFSIPENGLLLVGCTKHVIIFKEQSSKYQVRKILLDVFKGNVSC